MTARIGKESILLLVLPVAFMLGACASVGPPVLERAVIGYDETDAKLSQKLLLLNIARWRAGEIPHITVTSSIAATFDWTASTGIGGQIEESPGTDFFNLDFGARASENPTFSIVPLHGQDYIDRLIKPFTEDALQLLVFEGNIAVDRLLRLLGEGIELYGSTGEFQRFIGNSPERPEEYAEFRRIVLHLRWLAENRELFIRPLIFEDVLIRDITGRPSAEDLAKGIKEGVTWRQKRDGRFQASKLTQGRVVITNYDPLRLSDEERWGLNERIKRSPANLVYVEIAPGHPGGDFPLRGAIKLRSFGGIIKFVAEGMGEIPEFDVQPDPRTGPSKVAIENRPTTLAIKVTKAAPSAHVPSIRYRGQYFSVADTDWDRRNFRTLSILNQTTLGDVKGVGIPITISK